jgi:hypothetical protein
VECSTLIHTLQFTQVLTQVQLRGIQLERKREGERCQKGEILLRERPCERGMEREEDIERG